MGGKNEPSSNLGIPVNQGFNRIHVISALLQKKSTKVVRVRHSGVEHLAARPAATEVPCGPTFCSRTRAVDGIGECPELDAWKQPVESFSVLDDGVLEYARTSLPRVAMAEGMASELMAFYEKTVQVLSREYPTDDSLMIHQAE